MRFLVRGDLRPGANLVPLPNVPELQYLNQYYGFDPLANRAQDRQNGEILLVNFFKIVADFFHGEILAGFDIDILPEAEERQIAQAIFNRLFYGHGILVRWQGRLTSISPRFWWPLMEQGQVIGSVIVLPFSTDSVSGSIQGAGAMPNRAIATEHVDGSPSRVYGMQYDGITLGMNWQDTGAPMDQVVVFGDGISDFPQIISLSNAIDKLLKGGNRLLDRHSQPHLQVPAASVQFNNDGDPELAISDEGMIFPVNPQDKDVKYVLPAGSPEMWDLMLTKQLRLLASLTAIPSTVLQEVLMPRLESAESLEQLTAASVKKVRNLRNELAGAILRLGINLPRVEPTTEGSVNGPAANSGNG